MSRNQHHMGSSLELQVHVHEYHLLTVPVGYNRALWYCLYSQGQPATMVLQNILPASIVEYARPQVGITNGLGQFQFLLGYHNTDQPFLGGEKGGGGRVQGDQGDRGRKGGERERLSTISESQAPHMQLLDSFCKDTHLQNVLEAKETH